MLLSGGHIIVDSRLSNREKRLCLKLFSNLKVEKDEWTMYEICWDRDTGGIFLSDEKMDGIRGETRPVFFEELDLLGFDKYWNYPRGEEPLLWAVGGRKYYYQGELVAEAKGGGLFSTPELIIKKNRLS